MPKSPLRRNGREADADGLDRALVMFYLRSGLYGHAVAHGARGHDPQVAFLQACAIGMVGDGNGHQRAIRELETCRRRHPSMEYATLTALMHFHCKSTLVDHEAIEDLRWALRKAAGSVGGGRAGHVAAATFSLWCAGDVDGARRHVKGMMSEDGFDRTSGSAEPDAWSLRMWIDLAAEASTDAARLDDERERLEAMAKNAGGAHLDLLMAAATYHHRSGRVAQSTEYYSRAIAVQPSFLPALVQKAKILIGTGDWERAGEAVDRILSHDESNFEGLRVGVLSELLRHGYNERSADLMKRLLRRFEDVEGSNHRLLCDTARLFSRCSSGSTDLLSLTVEMTERACELDPSESSYGVELGYQLCMMGNLSAALEAYQRAAQMDESNIDALFGLVRCYVLQQAYEDAENQVEFLSVLQYPSHVQPEFLLSQAILASRRGNDHEEHCRLLNQAVEVHLMNCRAHEDVFVHYTNFNPDFILNAAKELVRHHYSAQIGDDSPGDRWKDASKRGVELLQELVECVPSHVGAYIIMAKTMLDGKEYNEATKVLEQRLTDDVHCSRTYLVYAQVRLALCDTNGADQALDNAISSDFSIRDHPLYTLIHSELLTNRGELDEARGLLNGIDDAPGFLDGGRFEDVLIAAADQVTFFLRFSSILARLKLHSEAAKILKRGRQMFRGTSREIDLLEAISNLALERNKIEYAIKVLESVSPDSSMFQRAHMLKADIFLQRRRDKTAYIRCYQDLASEAKTSKAYEKVGDAAMKVQSVEIAVGAYEEALSLNPRNEMLAQKIGSCLLAMHQYHKAQEYYRNAVRNWPHNTSLRRDLARLYVNLRQFEMAEGTMLDGIELHRQVSHRDTQNLTCNIEMLMMLADIYKQGGKKKEMFSTLLGARKLLSEVVEKRRSLLSERSDEQSVLVAKVCRNLGQCAESEGNDDDAVGYYQEALATYGDEGSMLALAKLYLRCNQLEKSEGYCQKLLQAGKSEDAVMLVADIRFLQSNVEGAVEQYSTILALNPNNYEVMVRFIMLLRRTGRIHKVTTILDDAEKSDSRFESHAGLNFAKGLFYRYSNKIAEAVNCFNLARRSPEWGQRALENMAELYLGYDDIGLWETGEFLKENDTLEVVQLLLKELSRNNGTQGRRLQVLQNVFLVATAAKENMNRAMKSLIEIIEQDKKFVPALLGITIVFLAESNPTKARSTLKRIAKLPHCFEYENEFECSYLALANFYVASGKNELARDMCERCLSFNKSSVKAWEVLGNIAEKERSCKQASDHYRTAWELCIKSSAALGYKLAYNYMKSGSYVEALDVCHTVLALYPDYPQMKEGIIDQCVMLLRP